MIEVTINWHGFMCLLLVFTIIDLIGKIILGIVGKEKDTHYDLGDALTALILLIVVIIVVFVM